MTYPDAQVILPDAQAIFSSAQTFSTNAQMVSASAQIISPGAQMIFPFARVVPALARTISANAQTALQPALLSPKIFSITPRYVFLQKNTYQRSTKNVQTPCAENQKKSEEKTKMKNKLNLIAAISLLLIFSNFANATVTVPLNTGYDHWVNAAYPITTGTTPQQFLQDDYWMHLSNPVANTWSPAYAITRSPAWVTPMMTPVFRSNWINSRTTYTSAGTTSPTNPGYTIYKKCFCLQNGYVEPRINFNIRADDAVTVWLNTILNTVLAPSAANHFAANPYTAATSSGFRTGSNCLYVLVEDSGFGATGFDLNGTVSAYAGLLSTPAKGPNQSYAPCSCSSNGGIRTTSDADPQIFDLKAKNEEEETVKEIVKFAEERRLQRITDDTKQK